MSHDLRTPLNAVIGLSGIAMDETLPQAEVRACLSDINVSAKHLLSLINDVLDMPKGIRVLRAYESGRKTKYLAKLRAEVTLEYDKGVPDGAREAIAALFSRESVVVEKSGKRGVSEVDLRPMLFALELCGVSRQELRLDALVSAQNPALNPQLLVAAIETYLPALRPDFARICRREVYEADGTVFR